jgi:hypothetical protein
MGLKLADSAPHGRIGRAPTGATCQDKKGS